MNNEIIKIHNCFIALSHYRSKIIIAFITLSLFSLVYNQRSLSLLLLYRFIALLIKDHYRFFHLYTIKDHYHFYRFIALSIKDHYCFYCFIAFFTCIQSKIIIAFIAFLLYCIIDQRSLSLLLLYHFFHLYTIKDHYRFYHFITSSHYRFYRFIALSHY